MNKTKVVLEYDQDLDDVALLLLLFVSLSLFIYSYPDDKPVARNLQVEYALPINKEFTVSVGNDNTSITSSLFSFYSIAHFFVHGRSFILPECGIQWRCKPPKDYGGANISLGPLAELPGNLFRVSPVSL